MANRTQVAAELFIIVVIAALLINIQAGGVLHFTPPINVTWYETSNESFTNETTAFAIPVQIGLNLTRNATAHSFKVGDGSSTSLEPSMLSHIVNATTDPFGTNLFIPAGSTVKFRGNFSGQGDHKYFVSWHLYALLGNGSQFQLCQSGDDGFGGKELAATISSNLEYTGNCTAPGGGGTLLNAADRLRLTVEAFTNMTSGSGFRFRHRWDDSFNSGVILEDAFFGTPNLTVSSAPVLTVFPGSSNATLVNVTNLGNVTSTGIAMAHNCPIAFTCSFNETGFSLAPNASKILLFTASTGPSTPPQSVPVLLNATDSIGNVGASLTTLIVPEAPSYTALPVGNESSFCLVQNTTVTRSYTLNNTGNTGLGPFTCTDNATNASFVTSTFCPTSIPASSADNATFDFNATDEPLGSQLVELTFNATNVTNGTSTVDVNVTVLNGTPVIFNKTIEFITENTSIVQWLTTEPGNSTVCVGFNSSSLPFCGGDSSESINHTIGILNLTANTTYFIQATSCNCAGCNSSDIENFTTLPPTVPTPSATPTPTVTPTVTPTPTPCGGLGEICCSEGVCDEGLVCTEGICATPTPTPSPTPTPAAPGGGGGSPGSNIIFTVFGPTGGPAPSAPPIARGACTFSFDPAPDFPKTSGFTVGHPVRVLLRCDGKPVNNAGVHVSCVPYDTSFNLATDPTGHTQFPTDGLTGAVCGIVATNYGTALVAAIYGYSPIPLPPRAPPLVSRGIPPQPPFGLYLSILAIIILLLLLAYFRRKWIARLLGMEQGQGRR